jgi:hypothetical protein
VVAKAIVVATGVTGTREREVLGSAVGDSEDGAFCPGVRWPDLTGVAMMGRPRGRSERRPSCCVLTDAADTRR